MPPKIIVITGPTATGKTALGVELAQEYNGEVVSADSMQVYRGMDIGTAKVTPQEARGVTHHMIDVADPAEKYSVARYVGDADRCCRDILSRGRVPIIVGGTGLYIDSLVSGRDFAADEGSALRAGLERMYDERGGESMLRLLKTFDPQRADKLSPGDRRRIVRAIEVYALTGVTITRHDEETRLIPPRYAAAVIALDYKNRADLYAHIDARVDKMVLDGLFCEVSALLDSGLPAQATSMQAIGYKEAAAALRGDITEAEAVEIIKRESRRYAKRQLTWLRRSEGTFWIRWEYLPDIPLARQLSTEFLHSRGL